jgi:hypothetical protein
MVVEETIEINAGIETVWNAFIDLTCWEEWNTVLRDVATESEIIREGQKFSCSLRFFSVPLFFEPEIEEVVPRRKVVWKGKKYGISSRHEFVFTKRDQGVRVTSRETFSGPVFSGVLLPKREIRKLTRSLLRDLKKASERSSFTHLEGLQA